jgi:ubiquinone/menaquinone biosynthesis C-methylase UbiE
VIGRRAGLDRKDNAMSDDDLPTAAVDAFYGPQYRRFGTDAAAEIRREVYGIDLGQQGWRGAEEQAGLVTSLRLSEGCRLLDIACGSAGPSLDLVQRIGCHLTAVDAEEVAIAQAKADALSRGLGESVTAISLDCNPPLPYPEKAFDAIACIDAILHLTGRFTVLADWQRLLRPGGRLVFTDAAVITGEVTKEELDVRASQGAFTMVPPGVNERAVKAAGLRLLSVTDTTAEMTAIASRWIEARNKRRAVLEASEGAAFFNRRQLFLATVARLASSGRLSRFVYVAEKPELVP